MTVSHIKALFFWIENELKRSSKF